jgi:cytochrome o ubiquinol oxidase subunit IV
MTDVRYDRAPGDVSISAEAERRTWSAVGIYTIGLALAVVLTGFCGQPVARRAARRT